MVGEAKLAGLLAEIVATDDGLATVVGIGINLTDAGPSHVNATSVLEASGITVTPRALLDILLDELEHRRARLETSPGREEIRREYEKALGQRVRVERRDDAFVGDARRVDDAGRLIVEVEGVEMAFSIGDVVHVRRHGGATVD
jgi:BirA family biotin operon repressor/biotin-[acetyl-CoA-carboxylase] ligase